MGLPVLPRELTRRIFHEAKRAEAAQKIQKMWRGRDVRDWLSYPGARAVQWKHPKYSCICHLRHCTNCLEEENRHWRIMHNCYTSRHRQRAWELRESYLMYLYPPLSKRKLLWIEVRLPPRAG
jgi:hypothetical protein